MKAFDYEEYRGVTYPLFRLEINFEGQPEIVTFGTESLNQALIFDGRYVDDEAGAIDEGIFFYIPDAVAVESEDMVREFIEQNLK